MPLDEWQEQTLEAAMGERANGRWASKFVGISAPRQNGKSQLIVARAMAGVLLFSEKMIIISAHDTDTAREVWKRLTDLVEANPTVEARVTGRMDAINREFVSFGRGLDRQTIKLKARRASGSRGFSADCLLLDEAQILGKNAWGSILPTMSAMPNPQLWLFGTPPTDADDPHAFSRVRSSSLEGKARHCWLEWSADPDDDIDKPATWAKANPAYGIRISRESCADERASMDDEQFRMERLGMWDASASSGQVIDPISWGLAADPASMAVERLALAVDVSPDRSTASVALAGLRADDLWHVELDEHRAGLEWVVPWVIARCERNTIRAVVIDAMSPAASLVEELEQAKIKVTMTSARDVANACAQFYDAVMQTGVRHTAQPQVNVALSVARKRPMLGGQAWGWNRKNADSDITPVVAETLALWGAQSSSVKKPGRGRGSSSSGRRATVI